MLRSCVGRLFGDGIRIRPRVAAAFALLLGIALTVVGVRRQTAINDGEATRTFDVRAERLANAVTARMAKYEYGLRGTRGAVIASGGEHFDRRRLEEYNATRDFGREFPGALGIGVVRRVAEADEEAFVALAQRTRPAFRVRQVEPHAGERFVIEYLDPEERNRAAIGLDVASDPDRRSAAVEAMRTGLATLTRPLTRTDAIGQQEWSFMLLLPMNRPHASLETVADRERATFGWAFAPLAVVDALVGLDVSGEDLTLLLRDVTDAEPQSFFASDGGGAVDPRLDRSIVLPIYGRRWTADVRATPQFAGNLHPLEPQRVGIVGLTVSALLASLVFLFARGLHRSRAVLAEQVAERTAELDAVVHDLESIVAAVPSTIGYWDRNLVNRMANRAYGQIFGRDPSTLPGSTLRELVGDARFEQHKARAEGALRGEAQSFELSFPTGANGRERHLLVSFVPDGVDGEVKGFYAFTHDVTELVEGRLELAAAQRDAAALLGTINKHAIVSVTDRAGRILEVNDHFCHISGYTREQLLGQSHSIVNAGVHSQAFWDDVWRTIGSGRSWRGEVCNRAADGSLFWVESIISPCLGDDGRIEKYISIRADVTARKIFAEDLRRTNERFEVAAAAAGFGVWTWDLVTGEATWDARCFSVFGRSPEDPATATDVWVSSVCADDRKRRDEEVGEAVNGTRPFDVDFRIEVPGGGVRHVRSSARVERDESGYAIRMIGVHMDITERRNAEIALRDTSSLLTTVLASSSEVAIIATDARMHFTVFNEGAERLLGYSSEEVVGVATPALLHDHAEVVARAQELSAALGRPIDGAAALTDPSTLGKAREWTYVRKDGSRVSLSLVVTEMRDAGGTLSGYVGIAYDVTARKEADRLLRAAVHEAKAANRAKSQFLANMSHEIRTPMNAVIGLSYLLERTNLDAEQASFLDNIRIASKSLLAIINDILDLSKIEASELKIERAPVDLRKLVSEQRSLMSTQTEAKGIGLVVEVVGGLPTVESDAVRVNQVLTNLLSNAIKFTTKGSVTLRVSTVAAAANCVRMRFAVEDSGIGISAEALPQLFSPFVQADSSTTRRFGGTGLGLSIVKQLVTLMRGEIGVTSTPGVGSVFWFELDFTLSAGQASASPGRREIVRRGPGLQGVRVLVADDCTINLKVAKRILELEGAIVTLATDGQQAVDRLVEAPDGYDVVLLDVQMPVLDGHDATRRIRQDLGLVDLPIIALTAGTLTSEAALAKECGMSDFVGKPFEPAALVRSIRTFVPLAEMVVRETI